MTSSWLAIFVCVGVCVVVVVVVGGKPHAIYNFDIISDHFKTTEKFIKPPSNHVQLVRYVYIHAWRHHTNAR